MVIKANGNVGIGTTSPLAKLQVFGTAPVIRISDDANGFSSLQLLQQNLTSEGFDLIYNSATGNTHFNNVYPGSLKFHTPVGSLGNTTLNERMSITMGGDVLFGTTSAVTSAVGAGMQYQNNSGNGATLNMGHPSGAGSGFSYQLFSYNNSIIGSIGQSGTTAVVYNTTSDYRLKEDLQDFKGLDMLSKIPVYDFKWKTDESRSYGVMAHELQEVLPQSVTGEKDAEEMQQVDYSKIVPLLIKSIQELKEEIEILKNK